jgi:ribosomal protein S18 acetylase RimI-like enzyme
MTDAASPLTIRRFTEADWPAVWAMLQPTFAAGDTYTLAPDISEAEARRFWVDAPQSTWVACDAGGSLLGTYFLKPNQPKLGAHVGNCGYVTSPAARGRGVAAAMCEHSQREAVAQGFRAMQFNFVVSTNEGAVRLWQRLGFAIVGTLPGAFAHPRLGYVDAYVMFKALAG